MILLDYLISNVYKNAISINFYEIHPTAVNRKVVTSKKEDRAVQ